MAEDDVKTNDYTAPGIRLKNGKASTVPINQSTLMDNDPLYVPRRKEGMYQYFEKIDYVPLAVSRGFRPVTRKEAGFVNVEGLPQEYGLDAGDVPHRVHDLVLMEGPQELYDAIDKERQARAREAIAPILRTANKTEVVEQETGNVVEDYREASITGKRIKDIQNQED